MKKFARPYFCGVYQIKIIIIVEGALYICRNQLHIALALKDINSKPENIKKASHFR